MTSQFLSPIWKIDWLADPLFSFKASVQIESWRVTFNLNRGLGHKFEVLKLTCSGEAGRGPCSWGSVPGECQTPEPQQNLLQIEFCSPSAQAPPSVLSLAPSVWVSCHPCSQLSSPWAGVEQLDLALPALPLCCSAVICASALRALISAEPLHALGHQGASGFLCNS